MAVRFNGSSKFVGLVDPDPQLIFFLARQHRDVHLAGLVQVESARTGLIRASGLVRQYVINQKGQKPSPWRGRIAREHVISERCRKHCRREGVQRSAQFHRNYSI